MFVATVIVSLFLAVALSISASGKLTRMAQVVENMAKAGVGPERFPPLAALEIAAAVGLVVGLWWAPLGIAAAIGVILYFIGAVAAHLRQGDRSIGPAAFLLGLGVVALVLRVMTA